MTKRFSQTLLDDLLRRTDIVRWISERVPLKKAGKNYLGRCPFHQEKTPSFTVSPEKQFFYCFGCGASGNVIGFVMRHQNLPFREAVQHLGMQMGIAIDLEETSESSYIPSAHLKLMEDVTQFYEQLLWKHPGAVAARAYLSERGLTEQTIRQFRLGFAPPGWDHVLKRFAPGRNPEQIQLLLECGLLIQKEPDKLYDRFRERIIFPIFDPKGQIIAFGGRTMGTGTPKYLNSPETTLFHKGQMFYGLHQVLKQPHRPSQWWVVEGYMDVITLAQAGHPGVVATMGTAVTGEHLKILFRYTSNILFCFDGDQAGRQAAYRALQQALPLLQEGQMIEFLFLPEREDPDSWVQKHGLKGLYDEAHRAIPLSQFFWQHLLNQINMQTVEGRAQLLAQAIPLIQSIQSSLMRDLFLQQLAQQTQLTRLQIEQYLSRLQQSPSSTTPSPRSPAPAHFASSQGLTPQRMLLALLVQNPQLMKWLDAKHLEKMESMQSIPGISVLVKICQILQKEPCETTAQLLERFRDDSEYDVLMQAVAWDHGLPAEGIEAECKAALERLKVRHEEMYVERLLQKASIGELSAQEKQELHQLLRSHKDRKTKTVN